MTRHTRGIVAMSIALSVSHDLSTGLTYAIVHGYSELQQAFIGEQIKSMASLARHPLLLPILFTAHMQRLLSVQRRQLWTQLLRAETASGQTGVPAVNGHLFSPQTPNFDTITKRVLGIMQCASAWITHSNALLLGIDAIQESVDYITSTSSDSRKDPSAKTTDTLKEWLDLVRHKSKVMLWDFEFFDKRAQAQMTAVISLSRRVIYFCTWLTDL